MVALDTLDRLVVNTKATLVGSRIQEGGYAPNELQW